MKLVVSELVPHVCFILQLLCKPIRARGSDHADTDPNSKINNFNMRFNILVLQLTSNTNT